LAVLYQVGRKEALRLFQEALKTPKRGKQADKKFNASLLRQIATGVESQKAVSAVAKLITPDYEDDEPIKKRIRRLRGAREKERARDERERRISVRAGAYHGTILGSSLCESKTDK
jgi:hypothetical protein